MTNLTRKNIASIRKKALDTVAISMTGISGKTYKNWGDYKKRNRNHNLTTLMECIVSVTLREVKEVLNS